MFSIILDPPEINNVLFDRISQKLSIIFISFRKSCRNKRNERIIENKILQKASSNEHKTYAWIPPGLLSVSEYKISMIIAVKIIDGCRDISIVPKLIFLHTHTV